MAVPKSAYQSPTYHPSGHHPNGYQSAYQAGYQAGYSNQQQKDDRISLPGIREVRGGTLLFVSLSFARNSLTSENRSCQSMRRTPSHRQSRIR